MRHGWYQTYNDGCRCDACRAANRERCAASKAKRAARLASGEVEVPHGVTSTYNNWGCRCGPCTEAHNRTCAEWWAARQRS